MPSLPSFFLDVFSNVVANIVFWLAGGLIFGLIISQRQRILYKFFGVNKEKKLRVYISSRVIFRSTGAIGIPDNEFQTIPSLSSLLLSNGSLTAPDSFAGLADSFWLPRRPTVEFLASPKEEEDILSSNTICIGGPVFNLVTAHYLTTCSPVISFVIDGEEWVLKVMRGSKTGQQLKADSSFDLAVIIKCYDTERGNTIFVLAGLGFYGTRVASEYLVRNWRKLHKMYGDKEFGLVLKCPLKENNDVMHILSRSEVVLQIP